MYENARKKISPLGYLGNVTVTKQYFTTDRIISIKSVWNGQAQTGIKINIQSNLRKKLCEFHCARTRIICIYETITWICANKLTEHFFIFWKAQTIFFPIVDRFIVHTLSLLSSKSKRVNYFRPTE